MQHGNLWAYLKESRIPELLEKKSCRNAWRNSRFFFPKKYLNTAEGISEKSFGELMGSKEIVKDASAGAIAGPRETNPEEHLKKILKDS